jgi:hypothetical protein
MEFVHGPPLCDANSFAATNNCECVYYTVTTRTSNLLENNGAGEGNRTLVTGIVVFRGIRLAELLDIGTIVQ